MRAARRISQSIKADRTAASSSCLFPTRNYGQGRSKALFSYRFLVFELLVSPSSSPIPHFPVIFAHFLPWSCPLPLFYILPCDRMVVLCRPPSFSALSPASSKRTLFFSTWKSISRALQRRSLKCVADVTPAVSLVIMPAPPALGALGLTFTTVRGMQLVSLTTIIGIAANFISELVTADYTAPPALVGTLVVVRNLHPRTPPLSISFPLWYVSRRG